MKAIVQNGYGDPERVLSLAEVDRPTVNGDDDVLVRIKATSVNTPDWITVAGIPKIMRIAMGLRRPKTPIRGTDVAGVVEQVGPGVTGFAPGDEVFGSTWIGMKSPGTYAEYTIIKASNIAKKPAELSFEDAAASVMSGLTALSAMDQVAKAGPGMHILINGASGGVGTFAVQFAKAAGAEVTGVCGTANVDLVRSLGADHVIDYTADDFTQGAARYDVILDNVVNHPPAMTARALAPGGVLLPNSVGNTGGMFAGLPRMIRAFLMGIGPTNVKSVAAKANHKNLTALAAHLTSGKVRVVTDKVYPLAQAPAAVAHMLGHHAAGKVVIAI